MDVKREDLVLIQKTIDGEEMYALRKDIEEICERCGDCSECEGTDLDDGECVTAYINIVFYEKKIFYESDLKEDPK